MGVSTHRPLVPAIGRQDCEAAEDLRRAPTADTTALHYNMRVSFRALLAMYLIVPLCALVYALDVVVFDHHLLRVLPKSPRSYFLLSILFGTPHIVASNLIFLTNRDYFQLYRRRALLATLTIMAFFAIGSLIFSRAVMFVTVSTTTIIHVIKQQIGIGNMGARLSGWRFHLWGWSIIAASVMLYSAIFFPRAISPAVRSLINQALMGFALLIAGGALANQPRVATGTGTLFLWGNTAMALVSLFFYSQGYHFFAVLGPRVIHDCTAFVFYVVHDRNRHFPTPQNWLYKVMRPLRISPVVTVPAIAVGLTLLQNYADNAVIGIAKDLFDVQLRRPVSFIFVGYLSMMHYYMEAFTWKTASPYRRYIAMSP